MLKAMLGKKLNMSQMHDSHGRVTPVTKIEIGSNIVAFLKEKDRDGYRAAQIGFGSKKKGSKALRTHLEKSKVKFVPAVLKEVDFEGEVKSGQEVKLEEVFRKGGLVDVVGKSKGKGFAGVIKRHGFHGGPKTHGQSDRHRAPGSIGAGTTPGRVLKGQKMPGHMGNAQVSVFGLEIMEVNKEDGILTIKGSVPGPSGSVVLIKKSKKKKADYHEPEIPATPILGGGDDEVKEEASDGENKTNEIAGKEEVKEAGEKSSAEN